MQTRKVLLSVVVIIPVSIIGRWYRSQYQQIGNETEHVVDALVDHFTNGRMITINTSSVLFDTKAGDTDIYTGRVLNLDQIYQVHVSGSNMQRSGDYTQDELSIRSTIEIKNYGTTSYASINSLQSNATRDIYPTRSLRELFISNYLQRNVRLEDLNQSWTYAYTDNKYTRSSHPHVIVIEKTSPLQFRLSYTHYVAAMPIHLDCDMIVQTSRSRSYDIDYACTGKLSQIATRKMADTLSISITPDTPSPAPSQYLHRSSIKETLDSSDY